MCLIIKSCSLGPRERVYSNLRGVVPRYNSEAKSHVKTRQIFSTTKRRVKSNEHEGLLVVSSTSCNRCVFQSVVVCLLSLLLLLVKAAAIVAMWW